MTALRFIFFCNRVALQPETIMETDGSFHFANVGQQAIFEFMNPLQDEVQRRGEKIFELVDRHPESLFSKAGFYQRMMALSMRDEHFKVQMFRFVDVLASLHQGGEIVRHLDEYFQGMRNGYAPVIRTGVQLAKMAPC